MRRTNAQPGTATTVRPARRDTSFETLPAYRAMKSQAEAGRMMGIESPFYRVHDVRAGAHTVVDGKPLLNFSSYDYLDLNSHPEIARAVGETAATWGTSVSASRITAGERQLHRDFEAAIADLYETEAALAFVSGHATNVSVISALVGPRDLVIHDAFVHNSIIVGCEASRAHRRIFAHNDLDMLESILASVRDTHERVLIVTEGLFSMDGDGPDLARLCEIKEKWGAWLMVDEAHALGVMGETGRGIAEDRGVDPRRVDIWMGTLSKTLCSCGGYIAGPAPLIEFLKYQAPGMVYSVGLSPVGAAAAITSLKLMKREPHRIAKLQKVSKRFHARALSRGLNVGTAEGYAVMPVVVGDSIRTVFLADRLFRRGINAFPIIPPGVPEKTARLRFFLSAGHSEADIDLTVDATAEELMRLIDEDVSVATLVRRFG
jgi:8-amino-7-oxononanoate synthase